MTTKQEIINGILWIIAIFILVQLLSFGIGVLYLNYLLNRPR